MQKYSDVVLDNNGKPVQGAVVTVTTYPEGAAATIYATDGGAPVTFVLTDVNGRFSFYAANGHYSLTVTGTGITPITYNDVTLWDPNDLSASGGAGLVGFGTRTVADKLGEFVSVKDAPYNAKGDGVTDDTAAIQAALDASAVMLRTVVLPKNSKFRITKSLLVRRGCSLICDGSPEIIADFAAWTGDAVGIKFLVDSADSSAQIMAGFGQSSGGLKLTGKNNAGIVSYGCRFYDATGAVPSLAVNYSYLQGTIQALTVNQFDTAIDMLECWNTNFNDLMIHSCRVGISIHGKSVNVTFNAPRITNPSTDFTPTKTGIVGVNVDSGFHYPSGVEGRPEGITILGGLVFGHDNNISINRVLSMTVDSVIIDGAGLDTIVIGSPSMVTVRGCYIYTSGAYSCVKLNAVSSASNSQIHIVGNQLVGTSTTNTCYGVYFASTGAARNGVKVLDNTGLALTSMVYAGLCPAYSEIRGNYGEAIASHHIDIRSGGEQTVVDGNHTSSDVFPVHLQPGVDKTLAIGKNNGATFSTTFSGFATLLAGATTVALPNAVYSGADNYCRAVTTVTPSGNVGSYWVDPQTNWSSGTLHVSAAPAANVIVYYNVISIPQSATV